MVPPRMSLQMMKDIAARKAFDGGAKITAVKDAKGADLAHTIVKTMMRIDLPQPLPPHQKFEFSVDWNYAINDAELMFGRTGYEFFEKDKNYIYELPSGSHGLSRSPMQPVGNTSSTWAKVNSLWSSAIIWYASLLLRITSSAQLAFFRTQTMCSPQNRSSDSNVLAPVRVLSLSSHLKRRRKTKRKRLTSQRLGSFTRRTCATLRSRPAASSFGMHRDTMSKASTRWPCPSIPMKPNRCGASTRPPQSFTL